ncbi:MAG: hypothetical protein FWC32_11800, partial [Firmicutes bacterium]|nr:hypothetical protein [Bacillota bacterium]
MAQIIRDYATGRFGTGQNVTILREYANRGLINGFDFSLSQLTLPPMVTGESFAMEYAIERILEYSTWPSVT